MIHARVTRPAVLVTTLAAAVLALAAPAIAGSHLWVINELFSNADGSVQFIEMKECCGAPNEVFMSGKNVTSDALGTIFAFTEALGCSNCTANKHLLLATKSFAALPGAPTPDYIIPANAFDLVSDTVRWHVYTAAPLSFAPGELPLDGVSSLTRDGATGPNTPTNFADETGTVSAPCHPADLDGGGGVDFNDLLLLLAAWGPCAGPCHADFDASNAVGFEDLLVLLAGWGPC